MAEPGADSVVVPVKTTEPEKGAPPTLAEPASGPVAEMTGVLPVTSKSPSGAAGATESALSATAATPNGTTSASKVLADRSPPAIASASAASEDTEMKDAPSSEPTTAPDVSGTPADKKLANGKRKSIGGVPEHKSKKLSKKKSVPKITHLDAQPGEYYFARLKSYPPWPSIVCDEEMLPTSLINTRPMTTKQADGTYKEAYADGGKKVMDRTFPVMFLYTNEFAWIPNTDLTPLDPAECKDPVLKGKSKPLLAAYEVAAEGHDISHFKEVLADHANALQEEVDRIEAREAEKAAKAEKKKRKSEVKAGNEDVTMADADGEPKKASKKRKKEAESDDEQTEKPAKTPKPTKIKLTTSKTPTTTEKKAKEPKSAKPKAEKKKKAAAAEPEAAEPVEEEPKPLDPVEERKAREKEVLFLRHKLQKGFLSREQSPREDEMPQMSNFIKKLEAYPDLEVSIIRATKINKVLKALVKLNTIPKDEEFQFRKRSVDLLSKWTKILEAEPADAASGDKDKASPTTNGVHDEKEKTSEPSAVAKSAIDSKDSGPSTATAVDPDKAGTAGLPPTVSDAVDSARASEPKHTASALAVDKAPESAAAAAQVQDLVKSTE